MAKAARQGKMTYLSWGVLTLLAPLCNQMEPTFEGFPFFFLVSFHGRPADEFMRLRR
jgi:hypothetical protein